ncbi:MAG: formate dehydrogenase accessory sulfurtransferase FdhD [Pseudomonadota bacterium]
MPQAPEKLPVARAPIIRWKGPSETHVEEMALIDEEPLSIRIQGKPYVVVMRTPGDEKAHAAGLCLAEGIANRLSDIADIAICDGSEGNVVAVTVSEGARARLGTREDRREWVSQTSCGLCGKQLVEELYQEISPVNRDTTLPATMIRRCMDELPTHQRLRALTRASHAAALYDAGGALLAVAEDVGRHNALDKVIGALFLEERLDEAALLVLSSRISYELVQKAARARIPVIMAVSRPTALAVRLAGALDICLAGPAPENGLLVYTRGDRLGVV